MTPREVLIAARARVAKGWTTGYYAIDAAFHRCDCQAPEAVAWCAVGALYAVEGVTLAALEACAFLKQATGDNTIVKWNDAPCRTQAEVLNGYDAAIALAGAM